MTGAPSSPWICPTCGGHYPPAPAPPDLCRLCAYERQWVPPDGQRWSRPAELEADGMACVIREVEPDLLGIGVRPDIGVGQRGLLVCTGAGNVLWDPPAYVDEAALAAVARAGGVRAVSASHPHMYGAMADWCERFDAPALLPEADAPWLTRPPARVQRWAGRVEPVPGVTIIRCGGHFPGSAALHWAAGAGGAGALLVGDTVMVTPGGDRVTFMWSPNRLPLPEGLVRGIVAALEGVRFERIYDGWWDSVLRQGGADVLGRDAERYIAFLRGDAP